MHPASKSFVILAVAAFAVAFADPALAGRRHKKTVRARSSVAADVTSSAAGATLSIRMLDGSNANWELRMQLDGAPAGLAPEAWIADATGSFALAAAFATDDGSSGEYRLRLRGKKGDALPIGAATLTELGGRAFEIRDSGVALIAGNLPSLGAGAAGATGTTAATGGAAAGGSTTGGTDDGATHDANDDHAGSAGAAAGSAGAAAGSTASGSTASASDDSGGHDGGSGGNCGGSGNSGGHGGHGGDDASGHH